MASRDTYWASWKIEKLLPELTLLIGNYFKKLEQDSILDLWSDCLECYYNYKADGDHGRVIEFHRGIIDGSSTDQINVRGNVFRALITNILQSMVADTPLWQPVASNSDYSTQAQVVAAKNLLDHMYCELKAHDVFRRAAESANIMGRGYVIQYWDITDKKMQLWPSNPFRVISALQANHEPQWYIVAQRVCKWDVVAKYQVPKQDVLKLSNDNILRYNTNCSINNVFDMSMGGEEWKYNRDYIDLFHFFHDRTAAMPDGRYVIFANDKSYYYDGSLPFDFPVHVIEPNKIENSPYAYSPAFDLIAYAKMHDATLSNMVDRLFKGRQWVSMQSDGQAKPEIDPANRIIKNAKAEAIDTTSLPSELMKVHELLKSEMKLVTARNDTVLGESTAKSGAHAALLYQVANQFTHTLNASFTRMIEDVGSAQLDLIKTFLEDPIMLRLSGEDNRPYLTEFKTDQIENIKSTTVKLVNPMLATPAGRLTIAQDVLGKEQGPDAVRKYLRILDGGNIDELYQDNRDLELTIEKEHDSLANYRELTLDWATAHKGRPIQPPMLVVVQVRALVSDPHAEHLAEHLRWRSSPRVRSDPQLIQYLDRHIEEHMWLSQYGDMRYLTASGQQRMPGGEPQGQPLPQGIAGPGVPATPPVPDATRPGSPVMPGLGPPQQMSTQRPAPRALPTQPSAPVSPIQGSPSAVAGSDATG